MIVVSDASPLFYLVTIGAAHVLPVLYGDVYIPPSVFSELVHPNSSVKAWIEATPDWLYLRKPSEVDTSLGLDLGEMEAIALAIELKSDRILIDETAGRAVARRLGLRFAGTLGVLLDAATVDLIDLDRCIDELRHTSFFMTPELLQSVRDELFRRKAQE